MPQDECPTWADGQQCTSNPGFMLRACPKSCGSCDAMRVAGAEAAAKDRIMWLTQPLAQASDGGGQTEGLIADQSLIFNEVGCESFTPMNATLLDECRCIQQA